MSAVLLSREGAVARIALNRAEAGNAIDPVLATALVDAVVEASHDDAVRFVVLTGTGRLFCADGDGARRSLGP